MQDAFYEGPMTRERFRSRRTAARLRVVLGVLLSTVASTLLTVRHELPIDPSIVLLVAGTGLVAGMTQVILSFLRGDFQLSRSDTGVSPYGTILTPGKMTSIIDQYEFAMGDLQKLKSDLASLATGRTGITEEEKAALLESLRVQFESTAAGNIAEEIAANYGQTIVEQKQATRVREIYDGAVHRLGAAHASLQRRSELNLAIGSAITAAAATVLIYMVLIEPHPTGDLSSVLTFYIPRVSTIAFIEVFAFFFLRLYRVSFDDLKFYQNEISTIQAKAMAIEYSLLSNSETGRLMVVGELARSDRALGRAQERRPGKHVEPSDSELGSIVGKVVPVVAEQLKK